MGPVGRLTGPLPSRLALLCSQLGQVLRCNISPYGGKKESEATRSVHPHDPACRPHVAVSQSFCKTASSSIFAACPTLGRMKFGSFQRSQGEVQQNVKQRSPRSTSDHVDPVGQSPCQVGPVGRPADPTL
jgi:hypothetical protein